jgi:hypothetical protein
MVKVLDFGIAKIVAEASTKQTAAMGSPIWMAPEQADQSPITPGTDVWALGLIAFFLITGRPYWRCAVDEAPTIPQILKEVLFEPIVPASTRSAERGTTLPASFDAWFARCVARDAQQRFPNASEAGAALRATFGDPVSAQAPMGFAVTALPGAPDLRMATGPIPSSAVPPAGALFGSPTGSGGSGPVQAATSLPTGTGGSYTLPDAGTASASPRSPRVPTSVVAAIFASAIVFGCLVAGAVWFVKRHSTATRVVSTAASPAPPDAGADMTTLLEAKRLSDQGKVEAAHERLGEIPPASGARQSADFRDIEFKWASSNMLLADRAPDSAAKRALLEAVILCPTVDETVRADARSRMALLDAPVDAGPARPSGPTSGLRGTGGKGQALPTSAVSVTLQAGTPAAPPPQPQAPGPAPPPQRSVYELASSPVAADQWAARRILEPKVVAGTATQEEARLLFTICKNQKDKPCQRMAGRALKH